MPFLRLCLVFALMSLAGQVSAAEWTTLTERDVFSDRRFGSITGGISSELVFHLRCDPEGRFALSVLYQDSDPAIVVGYPVSIAIRVDNGALRKLNATGYKHNEKYAGFKARTDMDTIAEILLEVREARRAIRLGVEIPAKQFRSSATLKIGGAAKAVRQFMRACKFK